MLRVCTIRYFSSFTTSFAFANYSLGTHDLAIEMLLMKKILERSMDNGILGNCHQQKM